MTALVTRPRRDADRLAAALRARGFAVLIEPLLVVLPVAGPQVDPSGLSAFLVTSANGVRALAAATQARRLPVYAVGEATAKAARLEGFRSVEAAGGDVDSLVALVKTRVAPAAGTLLHAVGSAQAGDLAGSLAQAGYTVEKTVLYEARPVTGFSAETQKALSDGDIEQLFLYSPRTAKTFVDLVIRSELVESCRRISVYALSLAVAEQLRSLSFRTVAVAPVPTEQALLTLLDQGIQSTTVSGTTGMSGSACRNDSSGGKPETIESTEDPGGAGVTSAQIGGDRSTMTDRTKDADQETQDQGKSVEPEASRAESGSDTPTDATGTAVSGPWGEKDSGAKVDCANASEDADAAYGGASSPAKREADGAGGHGNDGEPPPPPPGKKSGGGFVFILILLILIGAGAAGSYPWWRPHMPDAVKAFLPPLPESQEAQQFAALSSRLDAVEGELATVQGRLDAVGTAAETLDGLSGDLSALSERLEAVETEIDTLEGPVAAAVPATPADAPTETAATGTIGGEAESFEDPAAGQAVEPVDAAPATGPVVAVAPAVPLVSPEEVALLEREVDVLKGGMDVTKTSLEGLRADLDALAASLAETADDLAGVADNKANANDLLALTGRLLDVETLAQQSTEKENQALALMLSVGQLRQAALSGDGFGSELESVRVIAGADAAIEASAEALAPLADSGVALRSTLRETFPEVARDVARMGLAPQTGEWWARTLQAVAGLVTIRRTDAGEDPGEGGLFATVARAETAAEGNDLTTAIAALESLEGAPREAAAAWIGAAKARLVAETALSDMTARALARVGADVTASTAGQE